MPYPVGTYSAAVGVADAGVCASCASGRYCISGSSADSCVLLAVGLVPRPRLLVRFVYRVMFWTIARKAPQCAQLILK